MMHTNTSDSGFFTRNEVPFLSASFSEITVLHESLSSYCILYKAQKMGKWFVLKSQRKGYADNPFYQWLLYKDFEIGYQLLHKMTQSEHVSGFLEVEQIATYTLQKGDVVELEWMPDRCCRIEYLGEYLFRIVECKNTKLKEGDFFHALLFCLGQPLYLTDIQRNGELLLPYIAGRSYGLTAVKKL